MSDTTTGTDTTTTPANATIPDALPTSGATEAQIVSTVNDLIAYVATLPTSEASPLTSEQTDALSRVTAFFG